MVREIKLLKTNWIPSESPFSFREEVNPNTGERKYIMRGMMLPFGKISRNNVLYNKESIMDKHESLKGRPVMYNHKIDDGSLPIGHFTNSIIKEDGWYYEADIDPAETDVIRKLDRGDLRHVSIQLIGGKVMEKMTDDGKNYTEAYVSDIIEGSVVPAPGFLDTTASFAEKLNRLKRREDITTGTAGGAIGGPYLKGAGRRKKENSEVEIGATEIPNETPVDNQEQSEEECMLDELEELYPEVDRDTLYSILMDIEDMMWEDMEEPENQEALAEYLIKRIGTKQIENLLS